MTRMNAAELDELRARIPLPALIRRRTHLARSGRQWKGCCPFHGEKTPSFYVYGDHYHCFGCGAHGDAIEFVVQTESVSFTEAVRILGGQISSGQRTPGARPSAADLARAAERAAEEAADRQKRISRGARIYAQAGPPGTMVEAYLKSRGCGLSIPDDFRFHPQCPRPVSDNGVEYLPAMVAPRTDPISGHFVAAHCTFLRPDGCGKIETGSPKITWGTWGAIRLSADCDVTTGLGICEGIETGLAIIQRAGWRPVWAVGCAGAMGSFPVLQGVECLTIFPDRDDKGVGLQEAEKCAKRWRDAGREVRMIWPPSGTDWLDALATAA